VYNVNIIAENTLCLTRRIMVMHTALRKGLLILVIIIAPVCTLHAASDLVVTTLASPPATLTPGTKFSLTSTVTNQGDASSPKTMIQYYLAPGPSKEDAWLLTSKKSVKELAPRATYTGKAKITVPSGIPSGTYYLVACADDTNQAAEDNEDNNCTPSSAPVDLTAPDLVVTDLSGLPATSPLKAALSLTTSVKNEGTLESGPSRIYYYWSLDQTLDQPVKAGKQSVLPLAPKEVSTTPLSVKAPKTPGTYYLIACADGANKVKEEDDENNCLASSTAIIAGLPAISFSFSTDTQKIDSLPPGTTTITVTFDGVTREAPASGTTLIAFVSPDGDHAYSAQALSGTTILASLGPISLTTRTSFPLTIPLSFSYPSFDTYQTDIGLDTPNTLIYFGTPESNRIVQYGGAADDLLSVDTDAGNDWIEQYGGGGDDTMTIISGTGNDYIRQDGGAGNDTMNVETGWGDDWITVRGKAGNDNIYVIGGDGNDVILVYGDDGNDTILVRPDVGNDAVSIYGGSGDDTITYDASSGTDNASIDGGTGTDTLTVNNRFSQPILIQDTNSNVIYQFGVGGTTITVTGIEQITVNDAGDNPIFTWP
jgi:hypothetical protein